MEILYQNWIWAILMDFEYCWDFLIDRTYHKLSPLMAGYIYDIIIGNLSVKKA